MAKSASAGAGANEVEALFAGLTAATEISQRQLGDLWARQCDMMARYFAALGKSTGPEALMAANAAFMAEAMDSFGQVATTMQALGGEAPPRVK
jgi:hypothetical protein